MRRSHRGTQRRMPRTWDVEIELTLSEIMQDLESHGVAR